MDMCLGIFNVQALSPCCVWSSWWVLRFPPPCAGTGHGKSGRSSTAAAGCAGIPAPAGAAHAHVAGICAGRCCPGAPRSPGIVLSAHTSPCLPPTDASVIFCHTPASACGDRSCQAICMKLVCACMISGAAGDSCLLLVHLSLWSDYGRVLRLRSACQQTRDWGHSQQG